MEPLLLYLRKNFTTKATITLGLNLVIFSETVIINHINYTILAPTPDEFNIF